MTKGKYNFLELKSKKCVRLVNKVWYYSDAASDFFTQFGVNLLFFMGKEYAVSLNAKQLKRARIG